MDSYDPRLHPSHSADGDMPGRGSGHDWDRHLPLRPRHSDHDYPGHHHHHHQHSHRDRHAGHPYDDDRGGRDLRDRERDRDRRGYDHEDHHASSRHRYQRSEYQQGGYADHGHHDRFRDSRHMATDDRHHLSALAAPRARDSYQGEQARRPQEHRTHHHSESLYPRHMSEHDRDSSRDLGLDSRDRHPSSSRPETSAASHGAAFKSSINPLSAPANLSPLASPTTPLPASTSTPAPPPPLPSELHQLAEQGPMLHQAELAATHVLARQLPPSLMPDLLQDVDEILDLLLPAVLQSQQAAAAATLALQVDQVVATLESRVKSQLKLPRFTAKHLKTLREHPILNRVLNPVIDGEVKRVAGPRPT